MIRKRFISLKFSKINTIEVKELLNQSNRLVLDLDFNDLKIFIVSKTNQMVCKKIN